MRKRLQIYIKYIAAMCEIDNMTSEEAECLLKDLLIQIKFFQHERLVHLLVTLFFALMTIASLFVLANSFTILYGTLFILFLALTIPYIVHYYILENGTQKLYTYYDVLKEKTRS